MSVQRKRRLLTIGHSYIITGNRRLPHEMAKASNGAWDVSVAAPAYFHGNPRHGNLRPEILVSDQPEGIELHGVPMHFTSHIQVALYGAALRRLMQQPWDVVHCWEEPYFLPGAQLALWTPRSSVLTYVTYQNINKQYPPPFNFTERYTMRRADGWMAGAYTVEQALLQREFYRKRPHCVAGLGVDTEAFFPNPKVRGEMRATLAWSDDAGIPVIGYLGRFTEAKGVPLLLRTLDDISDPWRALIVGAGELEPEVRNWAHRYGDRVCIRTDVAHDQVPAYLNTMDMLVAPSQTTPTWREQFGRMIVEAFACGIPVITSDSGEIPYVVGDAGIIVPERDQNAWYDAIVGQLRDTASRREFGHRGLERVRSTYSWSAVAPKYLQFFEALLEKRRVLARVA
jgi:glycosyltransferase involved in cell wall biosynthesis